MNFHEFFRFFTTFLYLFGFFRSFPSEFTRVGIWDSKTLLFWTRPPGVENSWVISFFNDFFRVFFPLSDRKIICFGRCHPVMKAQYRIWFSMNFSDLFFPVVWQKIRSLDRKLICSGRYHLDVPWRSRAAFPPIEPAPPPGRQFLACIWLSQHLWQFVRGRGASHYYHLTFTDFWNDQFLYLSFFCW